jgi:hypothetical protein
MLNTRYVVMLFFIVLISFLCEISADVKLQNNQTAVLDGFSPIYIHTSVSPSVHYNCSLVPMFVGKSGSTNIIYVDISKDTNCHVVWKKMEGVFIARDRLFDTNETFIDWSVRSDGFYRWDGVKYQKRSYWYT